MWEEFLLQYFKFHFQYLYLDWREEIISPPNDDFRCSIFAHEKPEIKKIKKWQCGQFFDLNPTCASVGHNMNLIQRQQSIFSIIYTLRSSSRSLLNFLLNQWQNNWWLIITNSAKPYPVKEFTFAKRLRLSVFEYSLSNAISHACRPRAHVSCQTNL